MFRSGPREGAFRKARSGGRLDLARLKSLLAFVGLNLCALLALELLLGAMFAWRDARRPEESDPRARLPAYEGADYDPAETWREILDASSRWLHYEPYTVWSRTDDGELVSVDEEGNRRTLYESEATQALEVWVLGGSTTWGMGVPDAETVPSRLAFELRSAGIEARVENLAQTGFVATQEMLTLIRRLQVSPPPDVVIFYHGANQAIGAAEAPDQTDPHYLQQRIAAIFEQRDPGGVSPWLRLLHRTAMFRLATKLRGAAGPSPTVVPDLPPESELPSLAARAADAMLETYAIVEALAAVHGFRPLYLLQPTPGLGLKPLHESEQRIVDGLEADPRERWVIGYTRELVAAMRERRERAPAGFHDVTDVFSEVEAPVYLDWVHVSHAGNRRIARRIFELTLASLCSDPRHLPREVADRVETRCKGPGLPAEPAP